MTANKKQHKVRWIVLGSLLGIFVLIAGVIGGKYYMDRQRARELQLYQHGFRLYEEQIATYIKEHYSGIKKIEFSPIFIRRGGMSNAHIVPVLYDKYGNKAYLGRVIEKNGFSDFGLHNGLDLNRDGATGEEVIELENFDTDETYDVSGYKSLPDFAKLKTNTTLDENIKALVKNGQLVKVRKNDKRNSQTKVIYNLDIQEGDYTKWY